MPEAVQQVLANDGYTPGVNTGNTQIPPMANDALAQSAVMSSVIRPMCISFSGGSAVLRKFDKVESRQNQAVYRCIRLQPTVRITWLA